MAKRHTELRWEPLGEREKRALSEWASAFAKSAATADNSMRKVARHLLDSVLWLWTADAIDPRDGCVKRDAIKHDFEHLRYTKAALQQLRANQAAHPYRTSRWRDGLQHEHIVPKKYLLDRILSGDHGPESIRELLDRLCRAAIVTADEHSDLPDLPERWDEMDIEVRYRNNPLLGPGLVNVTTNQ